MADPLITNDAVVLGLLLAVLAFVQTTSHSPRPGWQRFYRYVPSLLLCYFLPAALNSAGIVSGERSNLYFVASRYLLPASLVLLTLSVDLRGILRLGPKAVIMFLTGTAGVIAGGPVAVWVFARLAPEVVGGAGPEAVWRGLATVAGSWIGGGANQTAMKEVFGVADDLFAAMITVDVVVASLWMAVLLYSAGIAGRIDAWMGADTSAIDDLRHRIETFQAGVARVPSLADVTLVLSVGFGLTGVAHLGADFLAPQIAAVAPGLARYSLTSPFFWIVVIATTGGVALSFTRARQLEGVGASRYGSLLLYLLVASVGMRMDILAVLQEPVLFLVGGVWMLVHITALLVVGRLIRAPVFFIAVGSQANIGGAASAPIVASAFHPALAPVGVLLAVLGYVLGTYGAWVCGILMQGVAP